jgi:hypothetical protein
VRERWTVSCCEILDFFKLRAAEDGWRESVAYIGDCIYATVQKEDQVLISHFFYNQSSDKECINHKRSKWSFYLML